MKTVICDASPLIFLAQLDLLPLLKDVLGDRIFALRPVIDEVCGADIPHGEAARLRRFANEIEVIDFAEDDYPSQSLSRSDRATLSWAMRNRPAWLLADERLLRRIAVAEGLSVIGTLGLLFGAARSGRLTREETRLHIDALVARHGFRISVELYRRVLAELAAL